MPSLAYRLAMVADGTLDASFIKPNSHDWDLAAADLILREAGGALLDEYGKASTYGGDDIRHGRACRRKRRASGRYAPGPIRAGG